MSRQTPLAFSPSCGFLHWFALALRKGVRLTFRDLPGSSNSASRGADTRHGRGLHRSSGRSERLIRVTTGSQARFSACGYTKSKQCMEPMGEIASAIVDCPISFHGNRKERTSDPFVITGRLPQILPEVTGGCVAVVILSRVDGQNRVTVIALETLTDPLLCFPYRGENPCWVFQASPYSGTSNVSQSKERTAKRSNTGLQQSVTCWSK